ncbi:MAG: diacylglycerol/lipid kinase family protein [Desulfatibacillaceae bacterium]
MKKLLFLINPVSGTSPGQVVAKLIHQELADRLFPWQYDAIFTNGNTVEQAGELAGDYEAVVGVGGDGTFGQIVQAVAEMEAPPKLGVIPYGVGNDLARSLDVYHLFKNKGMPGIIDMLVKARTRRMDVLRVDGEVLFSNYFGLGNDALVSNEFNRLRPRNLLSVMGSRSFVNTGLYGILILENFTYEFPFSIRLVYTDREGRELSTSVPSGSHGILVTNAGIYAGGAMISSKCNLCDGRFEVTVIENMNQWWLMHLTRFFKKPLDVLSPSVTQFQTNRLKIISDGQTFYQMDGEKTTVSGGPTEITVGRQMEVIIP